MSQQVETSILNLKELLELYLSIPEYQRPYTWTQKNVFQLLDDVIRFSVYPEYRIGTIILHNNNGKLDIVDGQQRIITSLLISRFLDYKDTEKLTKLDIPMHEKTIENIKSNFKLIEEYFDSNPNAKEILRDYFLEHCTVLVLQLSNLDEAFQLFDSSNNRGKALFPTDLLKAYHLREITGNDEKKREMVDLWENIKPEHVYILFSDYFFRIKQWSRNKPVNDVGFTNQEIDLFKGVSEANDNKHNNWSKSLLMAKNFVDNYNSQNQTMIEFKAMQPLNYPFQIDQPMINGEYFFKFVEYYYSLVNKLGFFEGNKQIETHTSKINMLINQFENNKYFRYVNSLYKTALLYVVDKFSQDEVDSIEKICFKYAFYPRFYFEQVQKKTINKYVTDSDAGVHNFFNYVNESYSIRDILHFEVKTSEEKLKNSKKMKEKWEKVYSLYFEGGN
ncbi:DUF262 domain-containing protein [Ureibacillus manganicus]|uniref:Uncharacterized protein n=1 Tax=Ureibacillus manganicus DSM 26584 TaxID=1384049 RepID=A0A0A3IWH4_9BACL|nr:DUF262 domain-containing protein [Ureibacillus manganicus]KGR79177.1 hypothetical protein CD29_07450 [Ureibacillus manganicus DSM 26584]